MTKTNEVSGYTHKYTIDLGTKEYINACFNNGGNSWDSRNGANYRFEKGTYTYSNGTIQTYEPPKPKELYADISLSAKTIPTKQSVTVSVSAAGGTAPYQYQYSYERNGSETVVKNYSSDSSANISISSAGLYTVKVSVKDATGKTIQKTADLTVAAVTIGSLSTNKASAKTPLQKQVKALLSTLPSMTAMSPFHAAIPLQATALPRLLQQIPTIL